MSTEFRLQDPGEGIHEADILEIPVAKGDTVKEGDTVIVAETDKAAVELPAPTGGVVGEIKVADGDTVEVGDLLMIIEDSTSGATPASSDGGDAEAAGSDEGKSGRRDGEADEEGGVANQPEASESASKGPSGSTEEQEPAPKPAHEQSPATNKSRAGERSVRTETGSTEPLATPSVRGLARDLDIELAAVSGSGKDGRVLEEDVRTAAGRSQERLVGQVGSAATTAESGSERIKLKSIRRAMARRMARSWAEIPHAVHQDRIDIAALERLRQAHAKEAEKAGGKLTLTPFLMRGLAGALREHPHLNAHFDAESDEIVVRKAINMGMAFDTERGLQVPVVHDVDRKSILQLATELVRIANKLKSDRVERTMLTGGTFTLTNVGSVGGSGLSPVINPPQVAIFGAGRAELRETFSGDLDSYSRDVTLVLPVCLAFDHRVVSGAEAARFMNTVNAILSDPAELTLRG